jgi:hypothetical protein
MPGKKRVLFPEWDGVALVQYDDIEMIEEELDEQAKRLHRAVP